MAQTQSVEELRSQVEHLEEELSQLRRQLAKAELDSWKGRIDDLEVQLHLASLDAQDHVEPLLEGLRNAWLDAQSSLSSTTDLAGDAVDKIREGLERTMRDLRKALLGATRSG
jgi:ElaB/YqjD/DUF883 family membrane-anchored ribosome-binding protein